jgi:hypothetical protein
MLFSDPPQFDNVFFLYNVAFFKTRAFGLAGHDPGHIMGQDGPDGIFNFDLFYVLRHIFITSLKTWTFGSGNILLAVPCSTGFINPKHEIRNSKQYPMFKIQMFKTTAMAKAANNGFVFELYLIT